MYSFLPHTHTNTQKSKVFLPLCGCKVLYINIVITTQEGTLIFKMPLIWKVDLRIYIITAKRLWEMNKIASYLSLHRLLLKCLLACWHTECWKRCSSLKGNECVKWGTLQSCFMKEPGVFGDSDIVFFSFYHWFNLKPIVLKIFFDRKIRLINMSEFSLTPFTILLLKITIKCCVLVTCPRQISCRISCLPSVMFLMLFQRAWGIQKQWDK